MVGLSERFTTSIYLYIFGGVSFGQSYVLFGLLEHVIKTIYSYNQSFFLSLKARYNKHFAGMYDVFPYITHALAVLLDRVITNIYLYAFTCVANVMVGLMERVITSIYVHQFTCISNVLVGRLERVITSIYVYIFNCICYNQ